MKITMTIAEIKAMVAREYVLPDEFDLEIVDTTQEEAGTGWISNVGNNKSYPNYCISSKTRIEVELRSGERVQDNVGRWVAAWREIDGHSGDIVAYRILGD